MEPGLRPPLLCVPLYGFCRCRFGTRAWGVGRRGLGVVSLSFGPFECFLLLLWAAGGCKGVGLFMRRVAISSDRDLTTVRRSCVIAIRGLKKKV
jgi:hypothetical protein